MRVLILEDDIAQVESLKLLLELTGHTVHYAVTPAGAKKIAAVHPPDIVILDLSLLAGSGVDFLRWMRGKGNKSKQKALARWKSLPVIVTTGLATEKIPDLSGLEPLEVLTKPYDSDRLCDRLAQLTKKGDT